MPVISKDTAASCIIKSYIKSKLIQRIKSNATVLKPNNPLNEFTFNDLLMMALAIHLVL
jgi:hypothetical protein